MPIDQFVLNQFCRYCRSSNNATAARLLSLFSVEKRLELSLVREPCLAAEVFHLKLVSDTRENLCTTRSSAELEPFHHLFRFERRDEEVAGLDSSAPVRATLAAVFIIRRLLILQEEF